MFSMTRFRPALALALVALCAQPALVQAATFTVDSNTDAADSGDSGTNPVANGICATAAANCTLRAAIFEANGTPGADTIAFASTMTGTNSTITLTVPGGNLPAITDSVTINGFVNATTNVTVNAANFHAFAFFAPSDAKVYALNNITVSNSRNTSRTGTGGQSTSTLGGGAIFFSTALPNRAASLTLTNVTASSNTATAGNGGGLYADLDQGGSLTITGGAFTGNTAAAGGASGGGVYILNPQPTSTVDISGVTISANNAGTAQTTGRGAGIAIARGRVNIRNSTISGNGNIPSASGIGGGIYLGVTSGSGGSVRLENVTISGNTATTGGGIGTDPANPAASFMIYSTVSGNTGRGIVAATDPETTFPGTGFGPGIAPFTSNIVAGNSGGNCASLFSHGDPDNSGFNLTDDSSCGFNAPSDRTVTTANLKLGALAANGTIDGTASTAALPSTHALLAGSVAIDAGNPLWVNATTGQDQRGADRQDGDLSNSAGDPVRDIGAYEFGGFGLVQFNFPAAANTFPIDEDQDQNAATASTLEVAVAIRRYGTGTGASRAPTVAFSTNSTGVTATAGTCGTGANASNDYTTPAPNPADVSFTTFGATQFDLTRDVQICNNTPTTAEGEETFNVVLAKPSAGDPVGYDFGPRTPGTVTIKDRENGVFQLNPLAVTAAEGNPGANGVANVTITRTGGSHGKVRVTYSTAPATATSTPSCTSSSSSGANNAGTCADSTGTGARGADYVPVSNATVEFADGETSKVVPIQLVGDLFDEPNQIFLVQMLTAPICIDANGATYGTPKCDAVNNTASSSANLTAGVTITDDEATSALTIDDVSAGEGDSGTKAFTFSVTLTPASSNVITVTRATANGTATASTTTPPAVSDYEAVSSGNLTFNFGETLKSVPVTVNGDATAEPDETFFVDLSAPTNSTLAKARGTGTILTDDTPGKLQFHAATYTGTEAPYVAASDAGYILLKVQRVLGSSDAVAVTLTLTAGTAATPGDFFIDNDQNNIADADAAGTVPLECPSATTCTVNFPSGDAADKIIKVRLVDDTNREPNETFTAALSAPTNGAVLGTIPSATATVVSDEQVRFQFNPVSYAAREGQDPIVELTVEALDTFTGYTICVPWTTRDSGAGVAFATEDLDYAASAGECPNATPDGTESGLVFTGAGTKKLQVMILDDGDSPQESAEAFVVDLLAPVGGGERVTSAQTATVTITESPRIRFTQARQTTVDEKGGTTVDFTVTRSGDTSATSTVQYQILTTAPETTATNGVDFSPSSGNLTGVLTFGVGDTTPKTVSIQILADSTIETDEQVEIVLSNATGAALGLPDTADVVITDDDYRFEFANAAASVAEDGGGLTLTVNRIGRSLAAASVDYATLDATATGGTDYTATSGTLDFAAGSGGSATFDVSVLDDSAFEGGETFTAALSNPSPNQNAERQAVGGNSTVTITDDDLPPTVTLSLTGSPFAENGGIATVRATLSNASVDNVTVNLGFSGTAMRNTDYTASASSITIVAGALFGTMTLTGVDDTVRDKDETVVVDITTVIGATESGTQSRTAEITDDERKKSSSGSWSLLNLLLLLPVFLRRRAIV